MWPELVSRGFQATCHCCARYTWFQITTHYPTFILQGVQSQSTTMTHILVNPGYPLHYRRSRTVDADLLSRRNRQQLAPAEFDRIRSESRQAWLDNWEDAGKACVNRQTSTTYSRLHNHKILDRQTKSRPTSPTRRNNPHPTK